MGIEERGNKRWVCQTVNYGHRKANTQVNFKLGPGVSTEVSGSERGWSIEGLTGRDPIHLVQHILELLVLRLRPLHMPHINPWLLPLEVS